MHEQYLNHSTIKAFQVLELLSKYIQPVKLSEIARLLKISQSTILRFLNSFIAAGYVYQDNETLGYALTYKVQKLIAPLFSIEKLRVMINPYLRIMSEENNVGVCIVALSGLESIYIDTVYDFDGGLSSLKHVGKKAPLHTSGSGKIFLSTFTEQELDTYIKNKGLIRITEYSITNEAYLREEIEKVKKEGFARDRQECEIGFECISVPIKSPEGKTIAAISCFYKKTENTSDDFALKFLSPLHRTADCIAGTLCDALSFLKGHSISLI